MKAQIWATELEAGFAISKFGFRRVSSGAFGYYSNGSCVLAVSGIGPVAAALCAADVIARFEPAEIMNFGACGALGGRFLPGDVLEIGSVACADPFSGAVYELCSGGAALVTSSRPVVSAARRAELGVRFDAADMEAHGILRAMEAAGMGPELFYCAKLVSDFSPSCDIRGNIRRLISNLEKTIEERV